MTSNLITTSYWEGENVYTVAAPRLPNGVLLIEGLVSGNITLRVYDRNARSPETALYTQTFAAGDMAINPGGQQIVDAAGLVNDGYWDLDAEGYTFLHTLLASSLNMVGGNTYVLDFTVPTTTHGDIALVHVVKIKSRYAA